MTNISDAPDLMIQKTRLTTPNNMNNMTQEEIKEITEKLLQEPEFIDFIKECFRNFSRSGMLKSVIREIAKDEIRDDKSRHVGYIKPRNCHNW